VEKPRMTVKVQHSHQELMQMDKETVSERRLQPKLLDLPEKATRRQHSHRELVKKVLDEVKKGQMKQQTGQDEINRMFYYERETQMLHYRLVPKRHY